MLCVCSLGNKTLFFLTFHILFRHLTKGILRRLLTIDNMNIQQSTKNNLKLKTMIFLMLVSPAIIFMRSRYFLLMVDVLNISVTTVICFYDCFNDC